MKIKELSDLCRSQELVIKEVNQQLNDKRALFASETQRMHQQSQQLQTEVQQLQAELRRVQNQLASHQQNSEQRLTSLMTQLNQSRQEQVSGAKKKTQHTSFLSTNHMFLILMHSMLMRYSRVIG